MNYVLETEYRGSRFRSRLEARWAVFFDHLGVRWEYEPEGYELKAGRYLPDFLLRGLAGDPRDNGKIWFEVKPEDATEDPRWDALVEATGIPLVTAFGMPRADAGRPGDDAVHHPERANGWMELREPWPPPGHPDFGCGLESGAGWDNHRAFGVCPECEQVGIAFEGRIERICPHGHKDDGTGPEHPRIIAAYTAARAARFGH